MKIFYALLAAVLFSPAPFTIAADKVVVVPLCSKPAKFIITNSLLVDYPDRLTVTDILNNLMWSRFYYGSSFTGANLMCDESTLGGYADWHLPTKDELKSLVICTNGTTTPLDDFTTCGTGYDSPTFDLQFTGPSNVYWTSTIQNADYSWTVNFDDGSSSLDYPANYHYVRCVRSQP